ncbi:unnamed protein product [Moneuplotes crassus]|uniref:Uncharacterized protein n=1 Tax=Euplotes crassus TaxID=5936 RepID=A0AAD1XD23_EUPCR|nr:unnamed protein product [Moneuplotes crassus]
MECKCTNFKSSDRITQRRNRYDSRPYRKMHCKDLTIIEDAIQFRMIGMIFMVIKSIIFPRIIDKTQGEYGYNEPYYF